MFIPGHNVIQSLDGSQYKTIMKRNQTRMVIIQICGKTTGKIIVQVTKMESMFGL